MSSMGVEILKVLWRKGEDGRWTTSGAKGLKLNPKKGSEVDYFAIEPNFELLTSSPRGRSFQELLQPFGHTDLLLQQSIVPVVAYVEGSDRARCIGTGFFISCSGYLATACHVLIDPFESGYASMKRVPGGIAIGPELTMGVLVPVNPAQGVRESLLLPFESARYWGEWRTSPLLHEKPRFEMLTDVAICKVSEMPKGLAHQPLNLSLRRFSPGEMTYTIGYAEMTDLPIHLHANGAMTTTSLDRELFVSVGEALGTYPDNHLRKEVPTPGPCFDYRAKVPGRMSGAPIFGGDGAVVRGVVSRSSSGERYAFGAMLGPAMHLPMAEGTTLSEMMETGNEGILRVQGQGL